MTHHGFIFQYRIFCCLFNLFFVSHLNWLPRLLIFKYIFHSHPFIALILRFKMSFTWWFYPFINYFILCSSWGWCEVFCSLLLIRRRSHLQHYNFQPKRDRILFLFSSLTHFILAMKNNVKQDETTRLHRQRTGGTEWRRAEQACVRATGLEAKNQWGLQEAEWQRKRRRKGRFLPCRRFGGDISSPNRAEATCREASRTCHGNSCGHFTGGREGGMKNFHPRGRWRREEMGRRNHHTGVGHAQGENERRGRGQREEKHRNPH